MSMNSAPRAPYISPLAKEKNSELSQKVVTTIDGTTIAARFAASTGCIQPACHMVQASQAVMGAVLKMNHASARRRPSRSDIQPPATHPAAAQIVVHRFHAARR